MNKLTSFAFIIYVIQGKNVNIFNNSLSYTSPKGFFSYFSAKSTEMFYFGLIESTFT